MNRSIVKRMVAFTVTCMMMILSFTSLVNAQGEVMPCYNTTASVETTVDISSTGRMTVTNVFIVNETVFRKATITTYIEKRVLGIFWSRVDMDETNDEWVDTTYSNYYSKEHSVQLPSNGTYSFDNGFNLYGMNNFEIAQSLFAHSVGKYASSSINKVNAVWGDGWLMNNEKNNRFLVSADDKNADKYERIWYAASDIKMYAYSQGIFITV